MMQGGGGMMNGMMGWGWLIGLLVIVLLIVGIVALVMMVSRSSGASWSSGAPQQPASQPDAMETLRQRFARGEMSREEFEQAREALRQT
jgi:putative membrane protein